MARAGLMLLAVTLSFPAAAAYPWALPPALPLPLVPADNPMSVARVALGGRLFADPRLSRTGTHSCASCHDPVRAFSDGQVLPRGATGEALTRNSPSIVYSAWNPALGWDSPGTDALEIQMLKPLFGTHPVELGLAGVESQVVAALLRDHSMAGDFAAAFPEDAAPVTLANAVRAIASFERSLATADSAFDRYLFGDEREAMGAAAIEGMALFFSERAGCSGCHSGITFAGPVRTAAHPDVVPRFASNGHGGELRAIVRVPSLRNVAVTAPYMRDGRLASLDAVIEHYDGGAAQAVQPLPPLHLTPNEKAGLKAFLESLTDRPYQFVRE